MTMQQGVQGEITVSIKFAESCSIDGEIHKIMKLCNVP